MYEFMAFYGTETRLLNLIWAHNFYRQRDIRDAMANRINRDNVLVLKGGWK